MHQEKTRYIYCIVLFVLIYLLATSGLCFAGTDFKTAILVSKKIRPYIQVVEGITGGLSKEFTQADIFFLSPQDNQPNNQIITQLRNDQYDLVVAIGPEATVLVWKSEISSKKFYAAVLDPTALLEFASGACGISLRIPVNVQVENFVQTFPNIKNIGLIFDPRNNLLFFEQAQAIAAGHGLRIIPLQVSSKSQIAPILKEYRGTIEAIWMIPDQTVISEKIIHYVIKQGLYNSIGVIGYNSFFARSGAFFSFEFDYKSLGMQAGEKMVTYLKTGDCREDAPVFKTIINHKVVDKIGIQVKE